MVAGFVVELGAKIGIGNTFVNDKQLWHGLKNAVGPFDSLESADRRLYLARGFFIKLRSQLPCGDPKKDRVVESGVAIGIENDRDRIAQDTILFLPFVL